MRHVAAAPQYSLPLLLAEAADLQEELTGERPHTPLHAKLIKHAETELNSLKTAESPGSSSQPSQPDSDVTVVLPTTTSS
ncbi:hypothetical protein NFJ02_27g62560 [Pycnococcus provasolii]